MLFIYNMIQVSYCFRHISVCNEMGRVPILKKSDYFIVICPLALFKDTEQWLNSLVVCSFLIWVCRSNMKIFKTRSSEHFGFITEDFGSYCRFYNIHESFSFLYGAKHAGPTKWCWSLYGNCAGLINVAMWSYVNIAATWSYVNVVMWPYVNIAWT